MGQEGEDGWQGVRGKGVQGGDREAWTEALTRGAALTVTREDVCVRKREGGKTRNQGESFTLKIPPGRHGDWAPHPRFCSRLLSCLAATFPQTPRRGRGGPAARGQRCA